MKIGSAALNTLLAVTCLVTCVDVARNFLQSRQSGAIRVGMDPSRVGKSFGYSDHDWAKDKMTVVLAVSRSCHFCTASAPFYKQLLISAKSSNVPVIAIAPDPEQQTRAYLNGLGLDIPVVRQVSFGNIGIDATPTLTVVNKRGRIAAIWVGKLSQDGEKAVLNFLSAKLAQHDYPIAPPS